MAAGRDSEQLTRRQIVRLAAAIYADKMELIAEGYMDLGPETIKNIKRDASNSEIFIRDIIHHWAYRNPDHQVQVRALHRRESAGDNLGSRTVPRREMPTLNCCQRFPIKPRKKVLDGTHIFNQNLFELFELFFFFFFKSKCQWYLIW